MKGLRFLLAAVVMSAAGCVTPAARPEWRSIEGRVVAADTGHPLAGARISIRSEAGAQFFPIRIPADAFITADREGKFSHTGKFYDEVDVTVESGEFHQTFRLPRGKSGAIEAFVLRVEKKKASKPSAPTPVSVTPRGSSLRVGGS